MRKEKLKRKSYLLAKILRYQNTIKNNPFKVAYLEQQRKNHVKFLRSIINQLNKEL